jgi:hypothetical protein
MKVKDMLGRELNVGDTIAYPRRSGSHLWMTTAQITDIQSYECDWVGKEVPMLKVIKPEGRKTCVYAIERVIRI